MTSPGATKTDLKNIINGTCTEVTLTQLNRSQNEREIKIDGSRQYRSLYPLPRKMFLQGEPKGVFTSKIQSNK